MLDGRDLPEAVNRAAALLATVVGQDLEETGAAVSDRARVAKDRVISTVDPRPDTATRAWRKGSTATRATSRSIPTAS